MTGRVLILGGTGEARRLAAALVDDGADVLSSLAGRVADPLLPPGEVRIGGFGGAAGLAAWLGEHPVRAVVDATHPFAAAMTANAAEAARVRAWLAGRGVAFVEWVVTGDATAAAALAATGVFATPLLVAGGGAVLGYRPRALAAAVRAAGHAGTDPPADERSAA